MRQLGWFGFAINFRFFNSTTVELVLSSQLSGVAG